MDIEEMEWVLKVRDLVQPKAHIGPCLTASGESSFLFILPSFITLLYLYFSKKR